MNEVLGENNIFGRELDSLGSISKGTAHYVWDISPQGLCVNNIDTYIFTLLELNKLNA